MSTPAGWPSMNGKEADLVGDGFEDFIALAEVVFAGLENVVHGGGGGWGAGFGLEVGNAIPDFALVGVVGAGMPPGSSGRTGSSWTGSCNS